MTGDVDVLHGVEASRRVGWARAYAAENEVARLRGLLVGVTFAFVFALKEEYIRGTSPAADVARLAYEKYSKELMSDGLFHRWSDTNLDEYWRAQEEATGLEAAAGWADDQCVVCHKARIEWDGSARAEHERCRQTLGYAMTAESSRQLVESTIGQTLAAEGLDVVSLAELADFLITRLEEAAPLPVADVRPLSYEQELRIAATQYADHPDYREEWKP